VIHSDSACFLVYLKVDYKPFKTLGIKYYSKLCISHLFSSNVKRDHSISFGVANAAAVIVSGGMAGLAYQSTTYPLDRGRRLAKRLADRKRQTWTFDKRRSFVRAVYRGMGPQLVRVMPPAAIGLLVFEIASNSFWDNDD
jgi:hypothetical protein